jgi:hypothetical protein
MAEVSMINIFHCRDMDGWVDDSSEPEWAGVGRSEPE